MLHEPSNLLRSSLFCTDLLCLFIGRNRLNILIVTPNPWMHVWTCILTVRLCQHCYITRVRLCFNWVLNKPHDSASLPTAWWKTCYCTSNTMNNSVDVIYRVHGIGLQLRMITCPLGDVTWWFSTICYLYVLVALCVIMSYS